MTQLLPHSEKDPQRSVNHFQLCILGNLSSDWLQTSIDEIWQPLGAKIAATRSLAHPDNECQRSVHNFGSCIYGNQGIAQIFEHIKEPLTTLIGKNIIYQRKNTDSKIINITNSQTCKYELLTVEYTMLISHYYHTAKSKALYESRDGPTDNRPNSDWLGDFH